MEQFERIHGALKCLAVERGAPVLAGETGFAELLHLGQDGKTTDETFFPHFSHCGKVGVAESCMLAPGVLRCVCGQAYRPCNGKVKHIQSPRSSTDLGEKASLLVAHPHHPASDQDFEVDFVELAAIEDIGSEAGNVIGVGEGAMFPVLAIEEDGAAALNAHHRPVAESYRSGDASVKIEEGFSASRHVVGGSGVEDPSVRITLFRIVEHGEDFLLHQLDALTCRRHECQLECCRGIT